MSHTTQHNAQQKQAAHDYLRALDKWDFQGVRNRFSDSPDFKYMFRPASLKGFGKPDGHNKEEAIGFMQHAAPQGQHHQGVQVWRAEPAHSGQGRCRRLGPHRRQGDQRRSLHQRVHDAHHLRARHGQVPQRRRDDGQSVHRGAPGWIEEDEGSLRKKNLTGVDSEGCLGDEREGASARSFVVCWRGKKRLAFLSWVVRVCSREEIKPHNSPTDGHKSTLRL